MDDYTNEQIEAEIERLRGMGIDIQEIGGFCPVQATGLINNRPFYFRARWGGWAIGIAKEGQQVSDAVDAQLYVETPEGCFAYREPYRDGEPYAAGYMLVREVFAAIEKSANLLQQAC